MEVYASDGVNAMIIFGFCSVSMIHEFMNAEARVLIEDRFALAS